MRSPSASSTNACRFDGTPEVAAAAAGDELGELCEHVIAKVLGPGDPRDDVAILAVKPLPVADIERLLDDKTRWQNILPATAPMVPQTREVPLLRLAQ